MSDAIIVVNAGSTSLKFGAYAVDAAGSLPLLCRGRIDSMQGDPHFVVQNAAGKPLDTHEWGEGHAIDHGTALRFVITWLEANLAGRKVWAAGHRVVLGGTRFEAPARIDGDVLDYLESLAVMEPSHQIFNVGGARALAQAFPGLPQVACFDSSFHRTMPEVAQNYALPKDVRDTGVRHWGYHGISYDYISRQVPKFAPQARRVIAAHLGGGASMCAMLDGRSVETSMGFAGASGLPMATRSGDVPLGALFYLLRRKLFDDTSLEKMLYERAGLLGLSGVSGDMRVLQESTDPLAGRRDGVFHIRDDEIRWRLCSRARRTGRLRVHRRHWRALRPGPRGVVRQAGLARREVGRAREQFRRPMHFHSGQRRVGLGHPYERRTDDRAAHAGARSLRITRLARRDERKAPMKRTSA